MNAAMVDDQLPLPDAGEAPAPATAKALRERASHSRFTFLGWLALLEAAFLASTTLWQPRPLGAALALGLLAALGLAVWRAQRSLATVRGQWAVPRSPHAGDEVAMGATLTAAGGAPPLQLLAFLPANRRTETVARLQGLDGLPTRPSWTTRFPRRGLVTIPPLTVRTEQPFGLVAASRTVGEPADVLVLPAIGRVRRELRTRINQWLEAQTATTDPGDDELARLRDYRPGDHPHRIHWKASARNRSLLVAERHAPGCRRLALVVDTAVAADSRRLERLVCIAATLVDHLLGLGWTLTLHGGFAPQGVAGDRNRLMEALALAGAGDDEVSGFIPPQRATVVLALNALPELELRPRPLVLTLGECEQLVRMPKRMR